MDNNPLQEELNQAEISSKNNNFYLIITSVLVLFGAIAGYYLGSTNASFKDLRQQNQQTFETQENPSKSDQAKFLMSDTFYIGPRPYQIEYEYDLDLEQGRIWLNSTADENEKYLLREEDALVGSQDHIKFSPSNSKFILPRTLGDSKEILLFEIEIDVDQVSGPGIVKVLSLQDSYGEYFHKIISWIDEENILIAKQYYDSELETEYYVAPIANLKKLRKVNLLE